MSQDERLSPMLPDMWTPATFGDVAVYLNGRAFKSTEWEESGRPILRIQNLTKSSGTVNGGFNFQVQHLMWQNGEMDGMQNVLPCKLARYHSRRCTWDFATAISPRMSASVIRTLLQEQRPFRYIAESLGRSASTICREIKRNSGLRGYRPKQAQAKADVRRGKPRFRKMTEPVIAHIETKLAQDHSPEQISGRMKREIGASISTSRIYQHVWEDKKNAGCLFKHLRIANGKKRRCRHGKSAGISTIPNRTGIEERPAIVAQNA